MKKAQIKMTETIAVIFIFFVLILFGIIFYYQYQKVSISERNEQFLVERAMRTTLKVLFMPELVCTDGDRIEQNCFDLQKLEAAGSVINQNIKDYYFNLFSYSDITVYQFDASAPGGIIEHKIYSRPKPEFTKKEPTYFILTLKDEITGYSDFGYLEVMVYS